MIYVFIAFILIKVVLLSTGLLKLYSITFNRYKYQCTQPHIPALTHTHTLVRQKARIYT